jgi:hypothetical protein
MQRALKSTAGPRLSVHSQRATSIDVKHRSRVNKRALGCAAKAHEQLPLPLQTQAAVRAHLFMQHAISIHVRVSLTREHVTEHDYPVVWGHRRPKFGLHLSLIDVARIWEGPIHVLLQIRFAGHCEHQVRDDEIRVKPVLSLRNGESRQQLQLALRVLDWLAACEGHLHTCGGVGSASSYSHSTNKRQFLPVYMINCCC